MVGPFPWTSPPNVESIVSQLTDPRVCTLRIDSYLICLSPTRCLQTVFLRTDSLNKFYSLRGFFFGFLNWLLDPSTSLTLRIPPSTPYPVILLPTHISVSDRFEGPFRRSLWTRTVDLSGDGVKGITRRKEIQILAETSTQIFRVGRLYHVILPSRSLPVRNQI